MSLIIESIKSDFKSHFGLISTPSGLKALKNFLNQYQGKDDHHLNLFELFLCSPYFHGDEIDGQYSTLFNNSIEKIIAGSRDLKQQEWESGLMWKNKVEAYQLLQHLFLVRDKITKMTFERLKDRAAELSIDSLQTINKFTDEIGQWCDDEKRKTILNQLLAHPDLFETVKRIDSIARHNPSLGLYVKGARSATYIGFIHNFFAHIESWSDEELFVLTAKEVREYLWNEASLKIIFTTKKYDDLPSQGLRDTAIAIEELKHVKKERVVAPESKDIVRAVRRQAPNNNKSKNKQTKQEALATISAFWTKVRAKTPVSKEMPTTYIGKLKKILERYRKEKSRWNLTTPDFVSALQVFTEKYKNNEDNQVDLYELLYCCTGENTMLNDKAHDVKVNRTAWGSLITFIAQEANARQDSLLKCLVGLIVKENVLPESLEWLISHPAAQTRITHKTLKDIEALGKDLEISPDNFKHYFNRIIRHPNVNELRSKIERIVPQEVKLALSEDNKVILLEKLIDPDNAKIFAEENLGIWADVEIKTLTKEGLNRLCNLMCLDNRTLDMVEEVLALAEEEGHLKRAPAIVVTDPITPVVATDVGFLAYTEAEDNTPLSDAIMVANSVAENNYAGYSVLLRDEDVLAWPANTDPVQLILVDDAAIPHHSAHFARSNGIAVAREYEVPEVPRNG